MRESWLVCLLALYCGAEIFVNVCTDLLQGFEGVVARAINKA